MNMNEERAREILKDHIRTNGELGSDERYVSWGLGNQTVTLDDYFTADELEAIAWWMRNNESSK
jgi:hypothetical protein